MYNLSNLFRNNDNVEFNVDLKKPDNSLTIYMCKCLRTFKNLVLGKMYYIAYEGALRQCIIRSVSIRCGKYFEYDIEIAGVEDDCISLVHNQLKDILYKSKGDYFVQKCFDECYVSMERIVANVFEGRDMSLRYHSYDFSEDAISVGIAKWCWDGFKAVPKKDEIVTAFYVNFSVDENGTFLFDGDERSKYGFGESEYATKKECEENNTLNVVEFARTKTKQAKPKKMMEIKLTEEEYEKVKEILGRAK